MSLMSELNLVTPLPKWRIAILCLLSMTQAIAAYQLMPYLPFMVKEYLGSDASEQAIATYTGIL